MTERETEMGREIVAGRLIAAPREKVFEAFSNPDSLARWWGPKGFTNTFHHFDFRPGGMWRFTMHGPNGRAFENESEFVEIAKPERIVFIHHRTMHWFRMTILFEEQGEKTKLTWRQLFENEAEYAKVKDFVPQANEQNFDRLEAELRGS